MLVNQAFTSVLLSFVGQSVIYATDLPVLVRSVWKLTILSDSLLTFGLDKMKHEDYFWVIRQYLNIAKFNHAVCGGSIFPHHYTKFI